MNTQLGVRTSKQIAKEQFILVLVFKIFILTHRVKIGDNLTRTGEEDNLHYTYTCNVHIH